MMRPQLMIFVNHLSHVLDKAPVFKLLNPLAPHISEELNEKLGYRPISVLIPVVMNNFYDLQ